MKGLKILIISVPLLFFSCNSLKINKNEEKIDVLNKNYFLETQKNEK